MANNHIIKIFYASRDRKKLQKEIQKEIDILRMKTYFPYLISQSAGKYGYPTITIIFEGP